MQFNEMLTVEQVAAVLNVSRKTVYELVASGELPAVHVGRLVRISEADLLEYMRLGGSGNPQIVREGTGGH